MVTLVNSVSKIGAVATTTPRIVELVGPAGAGKTTIFQTLNQRNESIMKGILPCVRSVMDTPFFMRHLFLLTPTLLRLSRGNGGGPTRREIAWMATLNGWHHVLRKRRVDTSKVVLLDQGPIFLLVQLINFGSMNLSSQSGEAWFGSIYTRWANELDMVVLLDAPDSILLERIRKRDKWHSIKEKPEPVALEFLKSYRIAYEQVISGLRTSFNGPRLLRFNTSKDSPDGIADKLLVEFNLRDRCSEDVC